MGFVTERCLPWMRPVAYYTTLVTNLWGFLDAVRRYPSLPEIDSFHFVKQMILLTAKVLSLAIGFEWRKASTMLPTSIALSVFVFVGNFLFVSCYVIALPLD